MDCNKDEAMRAKEIAEKKFSTKDFEAAKKFALKAQNLYPGLDGLPHMLATFDVFICASSKTNDEADTDWYRMLGINPSADDETIKKHYKKLALMLHPDKNKSIGAEGAFSLISEAFTVLSDKAKRATYDEKRNPGKLSQEKTPIPVSAANGSHDFSKPNVVSARKKKNIPRAGTKAKKPATFWTLCAKCKLQFEYPGAARNLHLICPNCSDSFIALEMPAPSAYGGKKNINFKSAGNIGTLYDTSVRFGDTSSAAEVGWIPFFNSAAPNVARAASTAQKMHDNVLREFEEAIAAKKQGKGKKRKSDSSQKMMSGASATNHMNLAKKKKVVKKSHGIKKLPQKNICKLLLNKARKAIRKKTGPHKSTSMKNEHSQQMKQ